MRMVFKSAKYRERVAWLRKKTYYELAMYYAAARHAHINGDYDVDFVIVSTKFGAHKIVAASRALTLVFAGSFAMLGKTYVEGVIRIDPTNPGNTTAACRLTGDDNLFDHHRGIDAFDVFRALDSFTPNRNGDGIVYPIFPEIDYSEINNNDDEWGRRDEAAR
jgi:hypothetical protein